jgi:hypothetical protein
MEKVASLDFGNVLCRKEENNFKGGQKWGNIRFGT